MLLLITGSEPFRVANSHISHSCVRRTRKRLERELPGCPFRWLTTERLRLVWSARVDDSWAAANACSGEPCRCLACTASFSRLTNLASNSSVVDKMYCRGSTLNIQELRYHVRSKDSDGTTSCACNTGRDSKREDRIRTSMTRKHSFP